MDILGYTIAGNSVEEYLIALIIFLSAFVVLKAAKYVITLLLKKISTRIKTEIGVLAIRIINRIRWPLFLVVSLYLAVQFIRIPEVIEIVFGYVLMVVAIIYVVVSIHYVIDYVIRTMIIKKEEREEEFDTPIVNLLGIIAKIALWMIAFIFILSNLGYNVTTLVAGLGIGGLVIAFGLQKVLQDLFASFSIYIDRPFVPGDFIIIGDDLGVVKKIGIKSTRIQHLGGQELVVSNRELTDVRVHNYKRMEKRRIAFTFGVTYQTPTKKLKKIPEMVREIIANIEAAEIDRVHFKQYGDFSLIFEVVYYVATSDYVVYMDTQQKINLAIKETFEKEEIGFAYPTQTLFLSKRES
jgi:small-conductance mechanosensitive channel